MITIEYEVVNKPFIIKANQDRLQQSLINLLINSRDAIKTTGRIKIHVFNTISQSNYQNHAFNADKGNYLAISVEDNGSGMSDNVKTHLFEPFFTTKESMKGSGLGLSSIYAFIKELNGYVTIESEPDNFTTITLFIPAYEY